MTAKFANEASGMQRTAGGQTVSGEETCLITGGRNVGDVERLVSGIGGGVLLALGISRRSLPALGLAGLGAGLLYRGFTGHCPCYQALGVNTAGSKRAPATSVPASQGVRVDQVIAVNRSPAELYGFWRNLENLPRIMRHLKSVTFSGGNRSHWVAHGPMGTRIEWDAEVINDRPGELIAWRSLPGSTVDSAGAVHFRPDYSGRTLVRVEMKYLPPAGRVGATVARLLGEAPEQQIAEDLRQFKEHMERGALAAGAQVQMSRIGGR